MYREQRNYENLQKEIFVGVGEYDIPEIKSVEYVSCSDWVGFSAARQCKQPQGKGCHFFIDDYRFNRIWTNIDQYIPMLQKFNHVLSPDFSTYTDFPKAIQIYNHYRKHWCGAYMQLHGVNVIPTVSWSTPDSFEWCFDGEPKDATVAVSSVGCMKNNESLFWFLAGYKEMIKRLEPERIIFYGKVPEECRGNIVRVKSFGEQMSEALCDGW